MKEENNERNKVSKRGRQKENIEKRNKKKKY